MKIKKGILTKINKRDIQDGQFTVPENVKEIGAEAFRNCTQLKKVKFLGAIEKIGYRAFDGCSSLSEIETSDGKLHCKIIDLYAFANCSLLEQINISDDLIQICDTSFCCSSTKINIDTSLFSVYSEYPIGIVQDFSATIYGENVFFHIMRDGVFGCLNLDIKQRELKDRINQCLKDNNIDDSKFFDYHEHEQFIARICDKFKSKHVETYAFKYDYREDFNEYMKNYISKHKFNEDPEIITFDDEEQSSSLDTEVEQTLNVTNTPNIKTISNGTSDIKPIIVGENVGDETVKKVIPLNKLKNYDFNDIDAYANELELTPWVDKLKQRISLCLLASNAPKEFFKDITITHVAFMREMLQCLSADINYDYKNAVDNYIKNYIETHNLQKENNNAFNNNLDNEKIESIKLDNDSLTSENIMLKQRIIKLEQELLMMKNQESNRASLDEEPIIETVNDNIRAK